MSDTKTKPYTIRVQVRVHQKDTSYPEVVPVEFDFKENLPVNTDAETYLRKRISEELRRAFTNLSTLIENKTPEAKTDELEPF